MTIEPTTATNFFSNSNYTNTWNVLNGSKEENVVLEQNPSKSTGSTEDSNPTAQKTTNLPKTRTSECGASEQTRKIGFASTVDKLNSNGFYDALNEIGSLKKPLFEQNGMGGTNSPIGTDGKVHALFTFA